MKSNIWTIRGDWPSFNPAEGFSEKQGDLFELMEDIIQAESEGGVYTIDVGWYPMCDPGGRFGCVVVTDDWDAPIEELRTKSLYAVKAWFGDMIVKYSKERN